MSDRDDATGPVTSDDETGAVASGNGNGAPAEPSEGPPERTLREAEGGEVVEVSAAEGLLTRFESDGVGAVETPIDTAEGRVVVVRLQAGCSWHRVEPGGDTRYRVETPTVTATTDAATFMATVEADGSCAIITLDGAVEVSSQEEDHVHVDSSRAVLFRPDGRIRATVDATAEELARDPWIALNRPLDEIDRELRLAREAAAAASALLQPRDDAASGDEPATDTLLEEPVDDDPLAELHDDSAPTAVAAPTEHATEDEGEAPADAAAAVAVVPARPSRRGVWAITVAAVLFALVLLAALRPWEGEDPENVVTLPGDGRPSTTVATNDETGVSTTTAGTGTGNDPSDTSTTAQTDDRFTWELTECGVSGGSLALRGTLTNREDAEHSYRVTAQFLDRDGERAATGSTELDVAAGETSPFRVPADPPLASLPSGSCDLLSIDRLD